MSNAIFEYYIYMGQNKQNQQSITKKTRFNSKESKVYFLTTNKIPSTSKNPSTPSKDR